MPKKSLQDSSIKAKTSSYDVLSSLFAVLYDAILSYSKSGLLFRAVFKSARKSHRKAIGLFDLVVRATS